MWIVKTKPFTRGTIYLGLQHNEDGICQPPSLVETYQADISALNLPGYQTIPMRYVYPAGNLGDIWRCDICRKLWRVAYKCNMCDYTYKNQEGPCRALNHMEGYKWCSDGLFLRSISVELKLLYKRLTARTEKTTLPNRPAI